MAGIAHTFVETRGFTTHVAECGKGPPLLLLHGWPEFWATWEPMFDRLGDRYRLIAPDFRGFGESGNPSPGRTDQAGADVLADDIAALVHYETPDPAAAEIDRFFRRIGYRPA